MSPFFKRKKSQPPVNHPGASNADRRSAATAESQLGAASPDDLARPSGAADASIPAPAPTRTREELLDEAYSSWHSDLAQRAQKADETTSDEANGIVDLTHPHPTGFAAFSSGSSVRITSLVRERFAQVRAMNNVRRLRATTQRIAEMYGHAPVSMSVGKLTWTELPQISSDTPTNVEFSELTAVFPMVDDAAMAAFEEIAPGTELADGVAGGDMAGSSTTGGGGAASDDARASDLDQAQTVDAAGALHAADAPNTNGATGSAGVSAGAHAEHAETPAGRGEEPREAVEVSEPAIFRAVSLEFVDGGDAVVRQLNHTEINPALMRALRENGATAEHVAHLRNSAATAEDLDALLDLVITYGKMYLPGFAYENEVLLGCFARPERTMLADLEAMEPYIRTSGIMMALAGDQETRRLSAAPLPPGGDEDRAPEVERGAGDLDVAELNAVEAVASGRSIVVDCPPGSQRVQTMASICADAAASNRSIVVVPARLSSGRQLIEELERLGLGDLVLDFSAVEKVAQRIRTGLRLASPHLPTDETIELRSKLVSVRRQLETFVRDLHHEDETWSTSVHDLLEKLAALMAKPDAPQTRVRLGKTAVRVMKHEGVDSILADLDRAAELDAFDPAIARSAWAASTISNATDGQKALDEVRRLNDITVPAAISQSSRAAGETSMKQPKSLAEWFEQIDVLDGIADSLDTFLPQVFETSPMNLAVATASKEWRDEHGHSMKMSDRRRYKKQALDLVRPGESTANLHEELLKVQERREVWRRYSPEGGWPTLPDGLAQIRATRAEVQRDLESLSGFLGGEAFFDMEFEDLQERLAALVKDAGHMSTLPERNATLASLRERGFGTFLEDMVARGVATDRIGGELDLAYTSAVFEEMILKSPTVASLGPRDIADLLEQFRELDRAHTRTLSGPVLRAVVNNARAAMQARRQDTLRLDEALAEHGTAGLRDAIATYSRLVQSARPVWVVPPNVLAEFIPPMPWADLAIVEASDAVAPLISPMMRGRQAVVVSDLRRPGSEAMRIFEDVLPVAELPTFQAEHDALSTYALKEIGYDLDAIPSVHAGRASRLIYVDGRGVPGSSGDGAVESTQVEVDAVVDAVIEHAISRPGETLAVVTLSVAHASRVREAIIAADSNDVKRLKKFVITDITRASGLKRDHVILSVGYGKTVHGRVLHTFGALATPSGLAGLIDAIAAAGSDLTVISALGPGDIDTRRVSTPGPKLLARLIEDADGSEVTKVTCEEEVAPLLADVAARLRAHGWDTRASYGYEDAPRIPLVVGKDGIFTVAVILDDEAYVAERSLRRRDRFWIYALQARGWAVFQTFSSSLFIDPAGQVSAIEALLRARHLEAEPEPVHVPMMTEDGSEVAQAPQSEEQEAAQRFAAGIDDAPVARRRLARPDVIPGLSLAAYTDDQLDDMIAWIASDGLVRGEDELVYDLRSELGIERRGEQVDIILRNVARRSGLVGVAASIVDTEPKQGLEPTGDHVAVAHEPAVAAPGMPEGVEAELAGPSADDDVDAADIAHDVETDADDSLPTQAMSEEAEQSLAGDDVVQRDENANEHANDNIGQDNEAAGQDDEHANEQANEHANDNIGQDNEAADPGSVSEPRGSQVDDPFNMKVDYEIVEERQDGLDLGDDPLDLSGDGLAVGHDGRDVGEGDPFGENRD
ncbi:hypothetical protein [Trueperella pecoris]|uniref:DNA helicase n=1 Tax=Trueperella pecoris TaxID=2733571 RepID=A0A7M1QTU1_9ACTO|nr:hypothetical protein [Trueperella pecoris]QOR45409.1 hypothetical protein INS88_09140 [Trueperella pecoris]